MRFSILASIFVSALSVCAQTSQGDSFGWSVELLQGLTQLPTCAVRISSGSAALYTGAPTRLTLTQGNCLTATLPQSRCGPTDLDCLCEDKEYQKSTEGCVLAVCTVKEALSESVQRPEPSVTANESIAATQTWQKKACKAPYRDTGISTRRISTGLVTTGGVCIALRFLARWRLQSSTIGWDEFVQPIQFDYDSHADFVPTAG